MSKFTDLPSSVDQVRGSAERFRKLLDPFAEPDATPEPKPPRQTDAAVAANAARKRSRKAEAIRLRRKGRSVAYISLKLAVDRRTVQRYLAEPTEG